MAKLVISPAANDDLISIRDYIANDLDSPKAAANTINKILKSIRILADFPLSGALLESIIEFSTDYRFIVSSNYISFYRYLDDTIFIDRVLYGGRDFMKILFANLPAESIEED